MIQPVLFAGCEPEVAAGVDGRILAVGEGARSAAGRKARVVRLRGRAWPGLIDSHIHLEGLADRQDPAVDARRNRRLAAYKQSGLDQSP
ncbi:MAG TPA: hypothetical protein VIJ91_05955 [Candidatus Dormibacteraeota bacterium]